MFAYVVLISLRVLKRPAGDVEGLIIVAVALVNSVGLVERLT